LLPLLKDATSSACAVPRLYEEMVAHCEKVGAAFKFNFSLFDNLDKESWAFRILTK
jgi:hypothetical protein